MPSGADVVNYANEGIAEIFVKDWTAPAHIDNSQWEFSDMNTLSIPVFNISADACSRGSMDLVTGGTFLCRRSVDLHKVYLCDTCMKEMTEEYFEHMYAIEGWAEKWHLLPNT